MKDILTESMESFGLRVENDFDHQWETLIRTFDALRKSAAGDTDGKLFVYLREACMELRNGHSSAVFQASKYLRGASDEAAKLAKEME